jgi:hypothetical protein
MDTNPTAERLGAAMFAAIVVDTAHAPYPLASSFSELHNYCDANEYVAEVRTRFGLTELPGSDADWDMTNDAISACNAALRKYSSKVNLYLGSINLKGN